MNYSTFEPFSAGQRRASVRVYWIVTAMLLALVGLTRLVWIASSSPQTQELWTQDGTDKSQWELVWADEFEGQSLNRSTWNLETINGQQSGNNELEIYTTNEANSPVSGGTLRITARKERLDGWHFTSARLTTQHSFSFQYGRVVARFKNPKGKGVWPAIWMLGSSIGSVSWPDCGEVDIMEMVGGPSYPGGGDDRAVGTAHWLGKVPVKKKHHKRRMVPGPVYEGGSITTAELASSPPKSFLSSPLSRSRPIRPHSSSPPPIPLHADFHVIALEWNQTHFVWFLDEVMFMQKRIDDKADPGLAAFHQPFFLLLNLAIGGNWPGAPDRKTLASFPHEFVIDYIRVYQTRQSRTDSTVNSNPEPSKQGSSHAVKISDSR